MVLQMDEGDLVRGMNKVWECAKGLGIQGSYSRPASLTAGTEFKALALNHTTHYEELYLAGLRLSEYNISLADYAYFQFSLEGENILRYAFYPNPFLSGSADELQEIQEYREMLIAGDINFEEYLQIISEIRRPQRAPCIRYENAPSQYVRRKHPCSHIHFGHHGENRWAVRRVLTAYAFGLIVLKHFYSDRWNERDSIRISRQDRNINNLYDEAKQESQLLADNLFSVEEIRQFHFS